MDMTTVFMAVAALASLASAYVLWKSKKDNVTFQDEFAAQINGILNKHKTDTVTAAVKAVQAATPVQATPVAPAPVAPAVEPLVRPGQIITADDPKSIIFQAPKADPVSIFLGPDLGTPAQPAVRDEMATGPMISQYIATYHPELAPEFTRVNKWYCSHASITPEDACKAITANEDLSGDALANAIGQQHRDDAAHVEGDLYNGPYPVGSVSLTDMYYLLGMKPRYASMTGRNVLIDVLYGSADKVNELINDAGSTHAAEMAQYDIGTYQGPLRPIVESRMNGR